MSLTDQRKLVLHIFELVEQDSANYSRLIEFPDQIDSDEPIFLSEQQIEIFVAKAFLPFNSEELNIKRDPLSNDSVKETLAKVNDFDTTSISTVVDVGTERSRLINVIDKKQLLLRNRFDKTRILYTTKGVSGYSSTASLTEKLEIKYISEYREKEPGLKNHADGGSNPMNSRKLTEEDVIEIFNIYANTSNRSPEIGKMFGITSRQVTDILKGHSWPFIYESIEPHIKQKVIEKKKDIRPLTEDDVLEIRRMYKTEQYTTTY